MNPRLIVSRGRSRELGPVARGVTQTMSVALSGLLLAIAFGIYVERGLALYAFLGGILALAFLGTTANRLRPQRTSWPGVALALLALGVCAYFIAMRGPHLQRMPMIDELSVPDQFASALLVLLVLEATRRCIGMTLVLLVLGFLAYGVWGDLLQGTFWHRPLTGQEILDHLVFSTDGLLGPALGVAAFLVFVFVIFGALLDRWGGGEFFHDLANSLFGRQVGGPAKVAVCSSGLYGSISGSPTADVVTTGSFTIPLMTRSGFKPVYAAGLESAASTGGALLPPVMGSAAFLMVDFTGIAYAEIVKAAIVPAMLYYAALFLAVHLHARRSGLLPLESSDIPLTRNVLRRDWLYFIPLGILVWAVLSLNRPVFGGAIACAAVLLIGWWRERKVLAMLRSLVEGLTTGMQQMVGVGVACAVAGLVVGTLAMADLTGKISSGMFLLAQGSLALTLGVSTAVIILLGMGMPTPAVYALAAVLTAPALTELGIALLPAHFFIVYFASMSAITPPVAVAAFAAASIARENPMAVALSACRVAVVAFVFPFVFVSQPALLLQGAWAEIGMTVAMTLLATIGLVVATEGFCRMPLGTAARTLVGALALGLLWSVASPVGAGPRLALVVLLLALFGLFWWRGRGLPAAPAAPAAPPVPAVRSPAAQR